MGIVPGPQHPNSDFYVPICIEFADVKDEDPKFWYQLVPVQVKAHAQAHDLDDVAQMIGMMVASHSVSGGSVCQRRLPISIQRNP